MNATKPLLFFALLVSLPSLAQDSLPPVIHAFHLSKFPHEGVLLYKDWKFHSCDSHDYAKPGFDNNYDIVKSYDGKIKFETKGGKRSEFIIQLSEI